MGFVRVSTHKRRDECASLAKGPALSLIIIIILVIFAFILLLLFFGVFGSLHEAKPLSLIENKRFYLLF